MSDPTNNRFYREPKPVSAFDEALLLRAILMIAPSHQGWHSVTGDAIAQALRVPFPLTMPSLRAAAIDSGFMPYDLWPWLKKLDDDRAAALAEASA